MTKYLIIILTAAVISYLLTFLVKCLSNRFGIIDRPDPAKIHAQPTPRLGGLAVYLGFALSVMGYIFFDYDAAPLPVAARSILLGGLVTLLVGALDDVNRIHSDGLSAVAKLVTLVVLTLVLAAGGIRVNFPFPYWLNLAITLVWLVGCVSAFNALDNMDGLSAGITAIASMAYLAVSIQTGQAVWGILAAGLMGATLGFLPHNFHIITQKPASIFMGDSGSFFLGFTLAALSIMGGWSTNPIKASIIPVLILGIPLFDLAYVIIRRRQKGVTKSIKETIVYSGQDHFSHRIHQMGFSRRDTVLIIYLIAFALALGAFGLRSTTRLEAILILGQFCLLFGVVIILTSKRLMNPVRSNPVGAVPLKADWTSNGVNRADADHIIKQ
ncbi:MAG: undecaprenyl/decaprenyl-phosphate alpha-N-acetylglucosaminyl 1-phosphate transferase [Planctomycetes bacterium]|nr:undecaprenyl/decaprenyl-phosphate alpha-N-acetylglucosaminyl 1-phosphate transferase [Planctomycetota bacterium]